MDALVVDVSACIPWCCEDEATRTSEELLTWAIEGSVLHVPSIWAWEILNAVAVVIKRRRLTADRGTEFLSQLGQFNFRLHRQPPVTDFLRLHALAISHSLTAYDVAYLDLAKRLALPLATRDADLKRAAVGEGLQVL